MSAWEQADFTCYSLQPPVRFHEVITKQIFSTLVICLIGLYKITQTLVWQSQDKMQKEMPMFQPIAPIPSGQLQSINFVRPDGVSRCTWQPGKNKGENPHKFQPHLQRSKISPNVIHCVGNTPLIRLNRIPKSFGIKCEMLAKCEFFNPAGSVKDRIAIRMIEDAEQRGLLKPGDTIIEPTSGNTGLGLAMAAAVKGYHCVIVMPLKMSNEKVDALKALGAEIIRTPTSCSFDSPDGLIAVAQRLSKKIPNSIILDQYRNSCNPIAHYEHTAEEILYQCDGKIDAIVCGAGTGGTITGIGRKIKEACPSCKVIGADPEGSILSMPEELNKTDVSFYEVEGIGYDFIPTVLDRSVVDEWHKTNDKDSLPMARRLIREEGLLCGGSSGTAMTVAIKIAKRMSEGERLVVLLPDGMRNYMTKFISDSWMKIRDLESPNITKKFWWSDLPANVLNLSKIEETIPRNASCSAAVELMKESDNDFLFVENDGGDIVGVITATKILSNISEGKIKARDDIQNIVDPVRTFEGTVPLERISAATQKEGFAFIRASGALSNGTGCLKYVTSKDLLNYICKDTEEEVQNKKMKC